MTAERRQVLAHGPLGRVENSTSLNVTVGHSDCWVSREGACGLWGAAPGIPGKASASRSPLCDWQRSVKGDMATP